jgi:hypothetical protein
MTRHILPSGLSLSRRECTPEQWARWQKQITRAVLAAWRKDVDIGDLVGAALQEAAETLHAEGHGAHAIVVHRSGSWEAEHIRALAGVYMLERLPPRPAIAPLDGSTPASACRYPGERSNCEFPACECGLRDGWRL